jgi:hypothetical protein
MTLNSRGREMIRGLNPSVLRKTVVPLRPVPQMKIGVIRSEFMAAKANANV